MPRRRGAAKAHRFSSGGLTPDNVAAAIDAVRPYAMDVSSGVETAPGMQGSAKLTRVLQALTNELQSGIDFA